ITWYDARNAGALNNSTQPFVTASLDGGQTFLPNVAVVSGLSTASRAGAGLDYGDYSGVAFYGGVIRPIFSDNSGSIPGNQFLPTFDLGTDAITINTLPPAPARCRTSNCSTPTPAGRACPSSPTRRASAAGCTSRWATSTVTGSKT